MKKIKNTLIQISHNGMGPGDDVLGLQLITNYFRLLNEETEIPLFIIFYNSGVKLICTDSPVIEFSKALEKKGVKLIACKTCPNHFNLMDRIETGMAGTMMDIIELQKIADKVIALYENNFPVTLGSIYIVRTLAKIFYTTSLLDISLFFLKLHLEFSTYTRFNVSKLLQNVSGAPFCSGQIAGKNTCYSGA